MKKMIARAGFLFLAAVLCSVSAFAYVVAYEENRDPSIGTPVHVEVNVSDLTDIEFINLNTGEYILVLDVLYNLGGFGGNFSVNLVPGDYVIRTIGSVDDEINFTISPQHQGVNITILEFGGIQRPSFY